MRREVNREGPLEALGSVLDGDAVVVAEPHRDVTARIGLFVMARELTHVAAAERDVRILRIDRDVGVLATGHWEPVSLTNGAVVGSAGDRDRAVVLLSAVNTIGLLRIGGHVIELRRGLIALRAPRAAAVHRDRGAAVVAVDETVRIFRIHPHDVRIAMRHADRRKRAAAVDGPMDREIHDVHGVLVHRIRCEAHVVEWPHHELLIPAGARPGGASIVRAEHTAQRVLCFDVRVYALRVGGRDRHTDLADQALRHAGIEGQFGPGVAAVGALPEAAAAGAGVHAPRGALELPHRCVHDARIGHVDRQVGRAGAVVQKQHLLPRGATVGGAEYPPIGRRAEGMPERRDECDIGIGGVHAQRRDLLRIGQTARRPRLPAVGRAIHAGAVREVFTGLAFARTDPDHVGIAGRHSNRANRREVGLAVGEIFPRLTRIRGLPHAAVHGAEIEDQGLGGIAGHGRRSTAAGGADVAPAQRLEGRVGFGAVAVQGWVVGGARRGTAWRGGFLRSGRRRAEQQERSGGTAATYYGR